jgi:phytol kinase
VLLVFWGRPQLVVAAMMPLTWGDALAAIVGVRFGRRKYTLLGYTRTFEGSLALFLITTLTTFLALVIIPPGLTIDRAAVLAAITALGAGLVEALSPHGLDNLTIPAISILILALFA